jgi:hypothetical protein
MSVDASSATYVVQARRAKSIAVPELKNRKFVLFYQKDWTLYLGDRSPNHKNSVAIMQEMGDATGIDASVFVAFHPGTHRGRRDTRDIAVMHTPIIELSAVSFSTATCIHTCTPGCCSSMER